MTLMDGYSKKKKRKALSRLGLFISHHNYCETTCLLCAVCKASVLTVMKQFPFLWLGTFNITEFSSHCGTKVCTESISAISPPLGQILPSSAHSSQMASGIVQQGTTHLRKTRKQNTL